MVIELSKKDDCKNKISYSFFLSGLIWNEYIDKQNSEDIYIGVNARFSNGGKHETIY